MTARDLFEFALLVPGSLFVILDPIMSRIVTRIIGLLPAAAVVQSLIDRPKGLKKEFQAH